ncbi:MAG: type III pantothenate kinase, partial [Kiritimatiellae bacterium]|nr:type III pantothenate kinase [Kiritimatiellia bacterium]
MRLVVVDVGNTSTAVGLWTNGRVGRVGHFDGGFKEASAAVSAMLAGARRPDAMAYVSVVPKADRAWRAFAASHSLRFHQVSCRDFPLELGAGTLRLDYPRPETIGADRLADAAGAVARHGAPVIVMDFG